MKAKVPKCHSLHIKSSSGTLTNPHLTCSNKPIRYVGNHSINFLGLPIQFPKDCNRAKSQLKSLLQSMLEIVDETALTRKQKVKIYSLGICPRLNWLLTIHEFPLSWAERQLEATANRYLKRWTGLTKSANPISFTSQGLKEDSNSHPFLHYTRNCKCPNTVNFSPSKTPQSDTWLKRTLKLR